MSGTVSRAGDCQDRRGNPEIWEPNPPTEPEYFPTNRLLGKMCCCKTHDTKPPEEEGVVPEK